MKVKVLMREKEETTVETNVESTTDILEELSMIDTAPCLFRFCPTITAHEADKKKVGLKKV
jgi:hypothetical protein